MNNAHVGAVNLPAAGQRPIAVQELEKTTTILVNIFRGVFVKASQVERTVRHGTDAAQPGGKSIGEPGLFQWRANQSADAVTLAPVEAGIL